jgi:hypothetical protein
MIFYFLCEFLKNLVCKILGSNLSTSGYGYRLLIVASHLRLRVCYMSTS